MNLLKISWFPDFIQYLPIFPQRFPDFSLTKFFKVRKCERCDSLNPRLNYKGFTIGLTTLPTTPRAKHTFHYTKGKLSLSVKYFI